MAPVLLSAAPPPEPQPRIVPPAHLTPLTKTAETKKRKKKKRDRHGPSNHEAGSQFGPQHQGSVGYVAPIPPPVHQHPPPPPAYSRSAKDSPVGAGGMLHERQGWPREDVTNAPRQSSAKSAASQREASQELRYLIACAWSVLL